jgi:hypothetical protein
VGPERSLYVKGTGLRISSMASKETLLADVLRLPSEERAEVAHKLLLSLEESADPGAEAEWSEELERRTREVLGGSAKTVP